MSEQTSAHARALQYLARYYVFGSCSANAIDYDYDTDFITLTTNNTSSTSTNSSTAQPGSIHEILLFLLKPARAMKAMKESVEKAREDVRRRAIDVQFKRMQFFSDFRANYRKRIGPIAKRVTRIACARGFAEERILNFLMDPFSFYRELFVCAVLVNLARQTATAKIRRAKRRKERIKKSILKRMRKCETYQMYEKLVEELEKFEEDEETEIVRYCSSDKRGLKRFRLFNGKNGITSEKGTEQYEDDVCRIKREKYDGITPREYDRALIAEQLRVLRAQRNSGDVEEIMFGLRAELLRNLGNMSNLGRRLHAPVGGVPKLVREYINEVKTCLKLLSKDSKIPITEKLSFLQETRHVFGRTGLLLSGGGSLGTFHIGVCRALNRKNLLPRVLAGSSVGSVIAAVICTRTSEELHDFFSDENFESALPDLTFFSGTDFLTSMFHYLKTGAMHDIDFFQTCLRDLYGDLTFQEAYDRSGGRILSICVSPADARPGQKPRLLNYLTAPHLVIWSAVAASCAFPSLFPPQPLLAKARNGAFVPWQSSANEGKNHKSQRWRDGSLQADLPMEALSQLFNVNYFIVSQTNPHIVPILRTKRWFASLHPTISWIADFIESEWKHRCRQFLDFVPRADILDIAKLFGQPWEGDVTVVMSYTLRHLRVIQSNPTREYLFETATLGERETWPKLGAIENACSIENTLDECVRELRDRKMDRKNIATRGRVPSWNTLNYCSRGSLEHMLLSKQNSSGGRGRSRSRGDDQNRSFSNGEGSPTPETNATSARRSTIFARRRRSHEEEGGYYSPESEDNDNDNNTTTKKKNVITRNSSLIFDNCDYDEITPQDIIKSALTLESLDFIDREKVIKLEAEIALQDFNNDKIRHKEGTPRAHSRSAFSS